MVYVPDIIMYLNYQFYNEMASLNLKSEIFFLLVHFWYGQMECLKQQTLFL